MLPHVKSCAELLNFFIAPAQEGWVELEKATFTYKVVTEIYLLYWNYIRIISIWSDNIVISLKSAKKKLVTIKNSNKISQKQVLLSILTTLIFSN